MTQKEAVVILKEEINRRVSLKKTNQKLLKAIKIATYNLEDECIYHNNFWAGWSKHKKYVEKQKVS